MVYYFKPRPEAEDYVIYMGLDKFENEDLIKYGLPEDIWFHVDKLSSAHVYVRLHKGQTIDNISPELLEDCVQLVKANSIQGDLLLLESGGDYSFSSVKVRTVRVEKRINDIVNRLNKTKVERKPDLKAEREAYIAAERAEKKAFLKEKKRKEELERLQKDKEAEIRSYKGLMVSENMTSNKDLASQGKSLQEIEEDFM